jgi:hypothetical protein
MAHKVILPPKKNYIPQFLKQRDINSYFFFLYHSGAGLEICPHSLLYSSSLRTDEKLRLASSRVRPRLRFESEKKA